MQVNTDPLHKIECGTGIGHSLEFDFIVTSAQLSKAVKADEISLVEPTQPMRLAQQSNNKKRLGLLSQAFFIRILRF